MQTRTQTLAPVAQAAEHLSRKQETPVQLWSGAPTGSILDEGSVEEKCEKTGVGCQWLWDDNPEGEDMFCQDCFRNRDWGKDEYQEMRTKPQGVAPPCQGGPGGSDSRRPL